MANAALQVWKIGFLGKNGKYVAQETIGDQINCSANLFRLKQTFTVEQEGSVTQVSIKTPRGGYWSADGKGNFKGTADSKSADTTFTVEVQDDGSWAFKTAHGYYVSAAKEQEMSAFARSITDAEKFSIQLGIHPQVCIFSPARNAYGHLEENELRANEVIPWGYDAMVTLLFVKERAKYAIRSSNGKFWTCNSNFSDSLDDSGLYVIMVAEGGKIAFKGNNGKYLTAPTSANSILKCSSSSIGANESFVLEDSHGQVTVTAQNKKMASISQNTDPQIVGTKVTDKEIFQMETDGKGWAFRTVTTKYWSVADGNLTSADKAGAVYFELEYDGAATMLKHNGKYVTYKPQGGMLCNSSEVTDSAKFYLDLVNRPQLIMRSDFGFVTSKRAGDVLACNSAETDTFQFKSEMGAVHLAGSNGQWCALKEDGSVAASTSSPDEFHIEWLAHTKFALRAAKTGQYLQGGQQGQFKANSPSAGPSVAGTLWEF